MTPWLRLGSDDGGARVDRNRFLLLLFDLDAVRRRVT